MVLAKDAIYTILDTSSGNWGAYDTATVRVEIREDVKIGKEHTANYDWVLIQGTKEQTGHPTLDLAVVDGDSVVRIDIRSTMQDRVKTLRTKIISILKDFLTNLSTPWNYMVFINRGIDMSKGKSYRYIIEIKLYIIDETLT